MMIHRKDYISLVDIADDQSITTLRIKRAKGDLGPREEILHS